MPIPLDEIKDGYQFQQIVAEYFLCFKNEKHDYSIVDIDVENSGIGGDDGCDILVTFHFADVIGHHCQKWVIECKSQKRAVGRNDIKNVENVVAAKQAHGYLLVCKNDATASLKRIFTELNQNNEKTYHIWNGSHFWNRCVKFKSLIQAFFPDYYQKYFIDTQDEQKFNNFIEQNMQKGSNS